MAGMGVQMVKMMEDMEGLEGGGGSREIVKCYSCLGASK